MKQTWLVKETVVLWKYVNADGKSEAIAESAITRASHSVTKSITARKLKALSKLTKYEGHPKHKLSKLYLKALKEGEVDNAFL